MLLRTKKMLLCFIALLCVTLFAVVGVTGFKSTTAHAYSTLPTGANAIGNLYDSATKKFSEANLNALAKKAGYANISAMTGKAEGGETKTASDFGETVVKFGKDAVTQEQLSWIPVYLSKDTSGNAVLTLWLATTKAVNDTTHNQEISQWNDSYHGYVSPRSNDYSYSMIRATTLNNGGTWYTNRNDGSRVQHTVAAKNNSSNKFEMYTTGELAPYITEPNKISTITAPTGYTNKWGDDKLWLPTYSDVETLWATTANQKKNNTTSWLSSPFAGGGGSTDNKTKVYYLTENGDSNQGYLTLSCGVRPALHLNLSSAVDTIGPSPIKVMTSMEDIEGTGYETFDTAWTAATAGNYAKIKLFSDVTTNKQLKIEKNKAITIDLNGYELKFTDKYDSGIRVEGEFTLMDSESDTPENQKKVHTINDSVQIKGGLITGSGNSGVYVFYASFNMYGGTIAGNGSTTLTKGGGVCVNKGTFTMNGGEISHNIASEGGGVYLYSGSTLSMTGDSKISDNTATSYGGVYAAGTLSVSGTAKIIDNKKGDAANNVYLYGSKNKICVSQLNSGAEIYVNNTGAVVTDYKASNMPQNAKPSDFFKPDNPSNNCIYISDAIAGIVNIGNHTGGTATCQKIAECEHCGEDYGNLASHDFASSATYKSDGTQHWKQCANCTAEDTNNKVNHSGGTATCTQKAKCSVCNAKYGNFGAHSFGTLIAVTPATCSRPGTKAHKDCLECNKHFDQNGNEIDDLTISALGHNYSASAWTWSDDGKSASVKFTCANNNIHGFYGIATVESAVKTAATCSKNGTTTYTATYTLDGKNYTDSKDVNDIDMVAHDFANSTTYKSDGTQHWKQCANCTAEDTDHKVNHDGTASCTEKAKCSVCQAEYGEVLEHDWDDGETTTPATCKTKGEKTFTCKRSGCAETKTEDIEIDDTAHSYAATWTSDSTGHWHAATCGHDTEKSGFAAHTAGEWIIDTPAQIGGAGSKHKECTVCGYNMQTEVIGALTDTLNFENDGENQVVVTTPEGFTPDIELVVTKISRDNYGAYETIVNKVNGEVNLVYDVTLKSDGVSIQPNGTLTIKLRIPENLVGKNFKLFHLHGNEATDIEYTVDGNYAVFNTDKLSEFIFVGEKITAPDTNVGNGSNGVWVALIVIMCIIILGGAGFFVYWYAFGKMRTDGKK